MLSTDSGQARLSLCLSDAELDDPMMLIGPFSTRRKLVMYDVHCLSCPGLLELIMKTVSVPDGAFVTLSVTLFSRWDARCVCSSGTRVGLLLRPTDGGISVVHVLWVWVLLSCPMLMSRVGIHRDLGVMELMLLVTDAMAMFEVKLGLSLSLHALVRHFNATCCVMVLSIVSTVLVPSLHAFH